MNIYRGELKIFVKSVKSKIKGNSVLFYFSIHIPCCVILYSCARRMNIFQFRFLVCLVQKADYKVHKKRDFPGCCGGAVRKLPPWVGARRKLPRPPLQHDGSTGNTSADQILGSHVCSHSAIWCKIRSRELIEFL